MYSKPVKITVLVISDLLYIERTLLTMVHICKKVIIKYNEISLRFDVSMHTVIFKIDYRQSGTQNAAIWCWNVLFRILNRHVRSSIFFFFSFFKFLSISLNNYFIPTASSKKIKEVRKKKSENEIKITLHWNCPLITGRWRPFAVDFYGWYLIGLLLGSTITP